MPNFCTVTAKVRAREGGLLAGAVISIATALVAGSRDATYEISDTSDSNGEVSFNVPQGSRLTLASNTVSGLNGAVVNVPNSETLDMGISFADNQTIVGADASIDVAVGALGDLFTYKGVTDCSTNPNYPAGEAGDAYKVSVAGKIGGGSGTVVKVGDLFICNTDATTTGTEAQKGTKWDHFPATADIPVKATGAEINTGTDDAKFVTAKAVADSTLSKGNTASYVRTTDGAQTLLGGNPTPRQVIIVVKVVTSFAAGDGAAPIFDIGETGTAEKFKANLNTGTAGDTLIFAGGLSGDAAVLVTATAATGTTSTGAIDVTVLAVPDGS